MLFDDGLIAFLIPLSIVFMTLGSVLLIIEYFKKEKNEKILSSLLVVVLLLGYTLNTLAYTSSEPLSEEAYISCNMSRILRLLCAS